MDETTQAAHTIGDLLQLFIATGGFRLKFRIKVKPGKPAAGDPQENASAADPSSAAPPTEGLRDLTVELSGPDTPILLARNGELLIALEHIAARTLRLEADQHDRISFDADQFKANRERHMREAAASAMESVRISRRPHAFPPMTSRERRMLHMILNQAGMQTESSGQGPVRHVVLYPEGTEPFDARESVPPPRRDINAVRKAFRPR